MAERIVPWFDPAELGEVYECFRACLDKARSDPAQEDWAVAGEWRRGVERVAAWAARGAEYVPASVTATAALVECLATRAGASACAAAIIRFVNLLVDQYQTKEYAVSIAGLAESLNLPQWIVTLRHAATHEHMPCTSLLRAGVWSSLAWLNTHFWRAKEAQPLARDHIPGRILQLISEHNPDVLRLVENNLHDVLDDDRKLWMRRILKSCLANPSKLAQKIVKRLPPSADSDFALRWIDELCEIAVFPSSPAVRPLQDFPEWTRVEMIEDAPFGYIEDGSLSFIATVNSTEPEPEVEADVVWTPSHPKFNNPFDHLFVH